MDKLTSCISPWRLKNDFWGIPLGGLSFQDLDKSSKPPGRAIKLQPGMEILFLGNEETQTGWIAWVQISSVSYTSAKCCLRVCWLPLNTARLACLTLPLAVGL